MGSLLGRQKPRPETKGSSVRFRDLLRSSYLPWGAPCLPDHMVTGARLCLCCSLLYSRGPAPGLAPVKFAAHTCGMNELMGVFNAKFPAGFHSCIDSFIELGPKEPHSLVPSTVLGVVQLLTKFRSSLSLTRDIPHP